MEAKSHQVGFLQPWPLVRCPPLNRRRHPPQRLNHRRLKHQSLQLVPLLREAVRLKREAGKWFTMQEITTLKCITSVQRLQLGLSFIGLSVLRGQAISIIRPLTVVATKFRWEIASCLILLLMDQAVRFRMKASATTIKVPFGPPPAIPSTITFLKMTTAF